MWEKFIEKDGVRVFIYPANFGNGNVIGFEITDKSKRLIQQQDPKLLGLLKSFLEDLDEIVLAGWSGDPVWWDDFLCDKPLEERSLIYETLIESTYSSEKTKEQAKKELINVKKEKIKVKEEDFNKINLQFLRQQFNLMRAGALDVLIEKYGYKCCSCGSIDNITIDHIKPLAKGGTNDLSNFQLLCKSCNSKKHTEEIDYREPPLWEIFYCENVP